ncbi:hypothetical protein MBLNU230_g3134t1 [Neophaeotheca triangularis]
MQSLTISSSPAPSSAPTSQPIEQLSDGNVVRQKNSLTGLSRYYVTGGTSKQPLQTVYEKGPPQYLTDPQSYKSGVRPDKRIKGDDRDEKEYEQLDDCTRKEPNSFFRVGRVFAMLHAEPHGTLIDNASSVTRDARFGERLYVTIRRFVTIRQGEKSCSAIPIFTYDYQGVGKRGVRKSDHAIIHTSRQPPQRLRGEAPGPGEDGMRPFPIKVDPFRRDELLHAVSRVNFAKVTTVEHNVKVKDCGLVNPDSITHLITQFQEVWQEGLGIAFSSQPTIQASSRDQPANTDSHDRADSAASVVTASSTVPRSLPQQVDPRQAGSSMPQAGSSSNPAVQRTQQTQTSQASSSSRRMDGQASQGAQQQPVSYAHRGYSQTQPLQTQPISINRGNHVYSSGHGSAAQASGSYSATPPSYASSLPLAGYAQASSSGQKTSGSTQDGFGQRRTSQHAAQQRTAGRTARPRKTHDYNSDDE